MVCIVNFSSRLKELRTDKNIRQKDLANTLKLAQTTIANYEQNIRFPDEEILRRIADYFNVSIDYLLGRTNIKKSNHNQININIFETNDIIDNLNLTKLAETYYHTILSGDIKEGFNLIETALKGGKDIREIYSEVFERTLKELGKAYEIGKVDISQEHHFSAATQLIMSQLYHYIINSNKAKSSVICLSVSGEMHNIGARMVSDFLEIDGWNAYYLSGDIPTLNILNAINFYKAEAVVLSATMSFNIDTVSNIITAIRAKDNLKKVKVVVGGQAFNRDKHAWTFVGADAYSSNAFEAVKMMNELIYKK